MPAATSGARPKWVRPYLLVSGGLVVVGALTAVVRLPAPDATVWLEAIIDNARPLASLPEPIADPDRLARLNIHQRGCLGGVLNEYEHAA
jgi:hypothetical protein